MHLKNVQSFGTEGRKGENVQSEIPGSKSIRSDIVFRVDHIKDFEIIRCPQPEKSEPDVVFKDPAIMIQEKEEKKENPTFTKKIVGKKEGDNPDMALISQF